MENPGVEENPEVEEDEQLEVEEGGGLEVLTRLIQTELHRRIRTFV